MKIAIVGGGFTGLSTAYRLSQSNHQVFLFEKEKKLGGLAGVVKFPKFSWAIEKHYHHFFASDRYAINLLRELGLSKKLLFPKTLTSIFYQNKIYPFNTPSQVLTFSPLSFSHRLKTGFVSLLFKILPKKIALTLEKLTAYEWIKKYYGPRPFEIIWEPLLLGKFGKFAKIVNMAWFWARIKKRTLDLLYLEGGYETLIKRLEEKIKANGGKIYLGSAFDPAKIKEFDKVIITIPSAEFIKIYPQLPKTYKRKLLQIPHLHALNLLLITREKILKSTYWLNVNDRDFPFVGIIQHTNMIDPKYYAGRHLTYIANYLPSGHPYLKMSKEELFSLYLPYLKKINPSFNFQFSIFNFQLFLGSFAQPVFPINYSKIKPDFKTPLKNVYLANMDMVYPWDRGVNYAIELGERAAKYTITQLSNKQISNMQMNKQISKLKNLK